jgi:hypothetical protein
MSLKPCAAPPRALTEPALAQFPDCAILPLPSPDAVSGVDVGEDFLDLAVLRATAPIIEHHRVALAGIEEDPLGILRKRLLACCPDLNRKWLALIDSPRWPRDLDYSSPVMCPRNPAPAGRILDSALRAMLRASERHRAMRLSMFPTPEFAYFANRANAPACKAHLRAAFRQLFQGADGPAGESSPPAAGAGANFTRFMLAGFVTFKAWQASDVGTLEAYPDLQFRLASRNPLPPKRAGRAALAARVAVIKRLRRSLAIDLKSLPATPDQADAEILALTAAIAANQGSLAALDHPAEGRFLITF